LYTGTALFLLSAFFSFLLPILGLLLSLCSLFQCISFRPQPTSVGRDPFINCGMKVHREPYTNVPVYLQAVFKMSA